MGHRSLVNPMRGRRSRLGLVGVGAVGPRTALGRRERVRDPVCRGLRAARLPGSHPSPAVDQWSRLEPEQGNYDRSAVRHYRDVLSSAQDAGVVPWVSLHHFTLPRFLGAGGFLVETNRTEAWRRHVEFVAETFGDLVGGWQPINETNYYARAAYGGRGWPPGHNDNEQVALVNEAIHLAFAEASVRLKETGAPVSSIFGLSPVVPQDDDPAADRAGTVPRRLLLGAMDRAVPGRRTQGSPP